MIPLAIGIALAVACFLLGGLLGIELGARYVIQRIRDYKTDLPIPDDWIVANLLTWLDDHE